MIGFRNNTITTTHYAFEPLLTVLNSSNCILMDNNLAAAHSFSLMMNGSNDNRIIHNTFSPSDPMDAVFYPVNLENCHGNELVRNIIQCSKNCTGINGIIRTSAAFDDTGLNSWNDTMNGNYWADWVQPDLGLDGTVDQPYPIDGGQGAMDYRPLVNQP
jgi:hypothetical protein